MKLSALMIRTPLWLLLFLTVFMLLGPGTAVLGLDRGSEPAERELLLAAGDALGSGGHSRGGFWFDRLEGVEPLMFPGDERAMGVEVAELVAWRFFPDRSRADGLPGWMRDDRLPRIVMVTLDQGTGRPVVGMGRGLGIVAAADAAVAQLRAMPGQRDVQPRALRVDLVHQVTSPRRVPMQASLTVDRSFVGIAFEAETGVALTPDEILARSLVAPGGSIQLARITEYLGRRLPQPRSPLDISITQERTLIFFSTHGFYADARTSYALFRGHRAAFEHSPTAVRRQAAMAGDYLLRMTDSTGHLRQLYLADLPELAAVESAGRHALAVGALAGLSEITDDPRYRNSARAALEPLRLRIRPMRHRDQVLGAIEENGFLQLDTNALAVQAYARVLAGFERPDPTMLADARRLAGWMAAIQAPDGSFRAMRQSATTGRADPEFVSVGAPAEAALAWQMLHAVDGEARWLQAAERTLNHLVNVRDADGDRPLPLDRIPQDEAQIRALLLWHTRQPNSAFLRRAAYLGNALMMDRITRHEVPDLVGALTGEARGSDNARRVTALIEIERALSRALPADQQHRLATLRQAIAGGASFGMAMQVGPELAMPAPEPERALGGVRDSLDLMTLRIDYAAHFIEMLNSYHGYLQRQAGQP